MKLIVMRHGQAEHQAATDAERELTARGRADSRSIAKRVLAGMTVDIAFVSPYKRAQQTADEVLPQLLYRQRRDCDLITPDGHSRRVCEYLEQECQGLARVMLISHNPFVTDFIQYLSQSKQMIGMDTSSIAMLDTGHFAQGMAELLSLQHRQ